MLDRRVITATSFICYKQQRAIRPLTCCNIQQCVHDTVFELRKMSFAIYQQIIAVLRSVLQKHALVLQT